MSGKSTSIDRIRPLRAGGASRSFVIIKHKHPMRIWNPHLNPMRTPILPTNLLALALVLHSTHGFAQSTCADLNINAVTYAAFNDSAIEVVAQAAEGSFFSYPAFHLVDAGGDTITREQVTFFGIGSNPQTHSSVLQPGQLLPPPSFTGTLVLTHQGMNGTETCTYPLSESLCPAEACTPFRVYFFNTGSVVNASFNWQITDVNGATVSNGTWDISTTTVQMDEEEVCLPAGDYTLRAQQTNGPTGSYRYGVTRNDGVTNGPWSIFFQNQPNLLPFRYFGPCIAGLNAITEMTDAAPIISVVDRSITVATADGSGIGAVELYDATGRITHNSRTSSPQTMLDASARAAGPYLLRVAAPNGRIFTQRILIL